MESRGELVALCLIGIFQGAWQTVQTLARPAGYIPASIDRLSLGRFLLDLRTLSLVWSMGYVAPVV